MVVETDRAESASIAAGKATGAANLDAVLGDRTLDAFVLFSSIAGAWGSGAQGGYSAANAYLDALAQRRRARGLAATSIAWGPWAGDGMAREDEGDQLARRGLRAMSPSAAVDAIARSLTQADADVVIADVDWTSFVPRFTSLRPSPLLADLPEAAAAVAARAATNAVAGDDGRRAGSELAARLAAAGEVERDKILLDLVRGEVAAVLGLDSASAVQPDRAFREVGFDSLTAVELRDRLGRAVGTELPSTLVFDYPAPADLARFLKDEVVGAAESVLAPVLDEIDRLEAAFARVAAADPRSRGRAALRMRRFLARLGELDEAPGADGPDESAVVESASDDELFSLLDDQLETPGTARKGDAE
jgi:acyl carrier protein